MVTYSLYIHAYTYRHTQAAIQSGSRKAKLQDSLQLSIPAKLTSATARLPITTVRNWRSSLTQQFIGDLLLDSPQSWNQNHLRTVLESHKVAYQGSTDILVSQFYSKIESL